MFLWGGGFLALVAAVIGLLFLFKRKGPFSGAQHVVEAVQNTVDKVNLEAKIKAAEAAKVEAGTVAELKAISQIQDRKERLDRLADLMKQ